MKYIFARSLRRISLLGIFFFGSLLKYAHALASTATDTQQATILGSVPAVIVVPVMLTASQSVGLPRLPRCMQDAMFASEEGTLIWSVDTLDQGLTDEANLLNSFSRREG